MPNVHTDTHSRRASRRLALHAIFGIGGLGALTGPFSNATVLAQTLPPDVSAAFTRQRIPLSAVGLMLAPVAGHTSNALLQHRAHEAMHPASVMKLITSCAALDLLGPAFSWKTQVFLDGALERGTLHGNLIVKGGGDPKLVVESLYVLLRRVRGLGIQAITGDIVLDNTAFALPNADPGDFDGDASRPYNAQPDALLVNFRSQLLTFTPMPDGTASVHAEPTLAQAPVQSRVPLNSKPCGDWRGELEATISNPNGIHFGGSYPAACGAQVWPLAHADPLHFAQRAIAAMWAELGARLEGQVRMGRTTLTSAILEHASPSLMHVLLDVNKFSNNVMARQVFLSLSLHAHGTGTLAASRRLISDWWRSHMAVSAPSVDNGSGLSLYERSSAAGLVALLQYAWQRPWMPELLATLPIAGVDGTLRRSTVQYPGAAHLKTGTIPASGVSAIAGVVHGLSGQRYALAILVNHANAANAGPAYATLINWAAAQ